MAKTKNKRNVQAKNNNDKLKTLKDLPMCKVVLHNIALDKDLVQLYQLHFSEKETKELEHSPYINTSKNSNNVWTLKENVWEDNIEETSRLTRSRSKKLIKKKNEKCKNIEFLDNIVLYNQYHKIIQPGFVAQKQQLKHDTNSKLILSKNNDETSSISSHTYCSHLQKKIVSINNKKHCNDKSVRKKHKLRHKRTQFNKSGNTTFLYCDLYNIMFYIYKILFIFLYK